ncbi:uncharacterized protein LOC116349563 [Contarinia nasturtii]|uniref:uncharacterized protein LOC116349563 n=1 Tax=Contarinia nasturtii TaxID=265458 RepID=UPI0012D37DF2|nr:uncharacterized protein LOC116349563 [Contarinia nasturtii]
MTTANCSGSNNALGGDLSFARNAPTPQKISQRARFGENNRDEKKMVSGNSATQDDHDLPELGVDQPYQRLKVYSSGGSNSSPQIIMVSKTSAQNPVDQTFDINPSFSTHISEQNDSFIQTDEANQSSSEFSFEVK